MKFRRTHKKTEIYSYELINNKSSELLYCKLQVKVLCFWITLTKYYINI